MCVLRSCPGTAKVRYSLSRFKVHRCERCGLMFRQPFPTTAELEAMYSDPQYHGSSYFHTKIDPRNPEVKIFSRTLDWLGRASAEEGLTPETLLDIGCGSGTFLRMARRRGWAVEGVEFSAELASRARDEFELDIADGDFLKAGLTRGAYDVIAMWDLLEHVIDPEAVLARARRLLAPGGRLLIFTIDSASLFNVIGHVAYKATLGGLSAPLELLYDARHNYYFTERSLARLIQSAGLGVEDSERHRAYLGRWVTEPTPVWIRAGGALVDFASLMIGMPYRQLLYCRPIA
jgi:2-polyprenyl-3-methyl-5-hydroxy-6-metoxy-1,4-benzoquinol methylase